MASTPSIASPSRSTSIRRGALTALVVLLGAVPVLLTAALLAPGLFASSLGVQSPLMAWVFGGVVAVGVILTPFMSTMGRVGAAMLAVGAVGLAIGRAVSAEPGLGPAFDSGGIDSALMFLIPTGYFILLFGALRALGWARTGSRIAAVVASALAIIIGVVPTPPLADTDMGNRLVTHGLIIAGAIVAVVAVMIEFARHQQDHRE